VPHLLRADEGIYILNEVLCLYGDAECYTKAKDPKNVFNNDNHWKSLFPKVRIEVSKGDLFFARLPQGVDFLLVANLKKFDVTSQVSHEIKNGQENTSLAVFCDPAGTILS